MAFDLSGREIHPGAWLIFRAQRDLYYGFVREVTLRTASCRRILNQEAVLQSGAHPLVEEWFTVARTSGRSVLLRAEDVPVSVVEALGSRRGIRV